MTRITLNPDELYNSTQYMYSQVVIENGTLYMSGQIGTDENNDVAGNDIQSQTRQAFENIGVVLSAVDKDFGDITKITSYMTDLHTHLPEYRKVWRDYFTEPYPCHTTIGVDKLSHIAGDELLVELEAEIPISTDELPDDL